MAECKYALDYSDPETGMRIPYKCHRKCVEDDQYCMFHSEEYYEMYPNTVMEQFKKEIVSKTKPKFVGCHLTGFDVTFNQSEVCFNSAVFHGRSIFRKVKCGTLDFTDAKFCENMRMQDIKVENIFMHNLRFDNIKHNKNQKSKTAKIVINEIEFIRCEIKKIDISTRKFQYPLYMEDCNIENCLFLRSILKGGISATRCTFTKDVVFRNSVFRGNSEFNKCRFKERLEFHKVRFRADTSFYDTTFNSQELVIFDGNLSNISFAGTDITKVGFGVNVIWGGEDKHTIRDEKYLRKGKKIDLNQTISTYRNLRENRESRLMYSTAGKFFVKEMELQRNFENKDGEIKRRGHLRRRVSISCIYLCLSKYGESPKRLLPYAAFVLLVGMGIFYPEDQWAPPDSCFPITWDGAERAFEGILKAIFGTNITSPEELVVRVPVLFLIGMGFISLRRIYERRFIH